MRIQNRIRRKTRGVSPVIATVLLIGLTVVAGIAVAVMLFGAVNAPDPIKVVVLSISEFKTTDDDILIDQFSITIQNDESTNVRIESDSFVVKNATDQNQTELTDWSVDLDYDEIYLLGLAIQTFTLSCDSTLDYAELTPRDDLIIIEITVFPEDSTNLRNAKTFKSDILRMGDTYGPVSLTSLNSETNFGLEGLNLNFNVTNYGSSDLDLIIDFSTDSSESINFAIDGNNQTNQLYFSLLQNSNTNFTSNTFTVLPTGLTVTDTDYMVLVTIWNQANLEIVSFASLILTYSG
ncbi:MAG: archaellin/type IV pilin N-terminal domain-containing protein [Candidatus Hodarchaeales archaeon]|jgi:flagellin-like protein